MNVPLFAQYSEISWRTVALRTPLILDWYSFGMTLRTAFLKENTQANKALAARNYQI